MKHSLLPIIFCLVLNMGYQKAQAQDVLLTTDPTLGEVLTDANGNILYFFTRDAAANSSSCSGGCLTAWPIFHIDTPSVGAGLETADFNAFMRSDGQMQTTYKGWPLYYFANDVNAGDTNGEGANNVWFVAKPDYTLMLMDNLLIGLDGITYNSTYEPGEESIQYFVDAQGRTLYTWVNDNFEQNNFTSEDFSNNGAWPIFEENSTTFPSTLDASLFSAIDVFGIPQLTYNGWPLYYFGQDTERGQTKGVSVPVAGIWPVAVAGVDPASPVAVESPRELETWKISPNPSNGTTTVIELQLSHPMMLSLRISNALGHILWTQSNLSLSGGSHSLEIQNIMNFPEGVYWVQVLNEKGNFATQLFLKQ